MAEGRAREGFPCQVFRGMWLSKAGSGCVRVEGMGGRAEMCGETMSRFRDHQEETLW